MKQRHMLKYTISCCFVLFSCVFYAQDKTTTSPVSEKDSIAISALENTVTKDSVAFKKNYGLRLGIDLSKPILSLTKDNYSGFEIVGDYRIKRNLYIAAEMGYGEQNTRRDTYRYTTDGSFITAGINVNTFKNWLEMDNEIYLGARYGFSTFSQTVENYTIYQEGTEINGVSGPYFEPRYEDTPVTHDSLTAHWFSIVFGFKVQTLKNLYLGFSFQMNRMLSTTEPDNFKNLHVPGFNKVYSSDTGVGFNYTISYRIPLYKK